MAFFDVLIMKRTMRVQMIIVLFKQMILRKYKTDVLRNFTFIIFVAIGNFKVNTND